MFKDDLVSGYFFRARHKSTVEVWQYHCWYSQRSQACSSVWEAGLNQSYFSTFLYSAGSDRFDERSYSEHFLLLESWLLFKALHELCSASSSGKYCLKSNICPFIKFCLWVDPQEAIPFSRNCVFMTSYWNHNQIPVFARSVMQAVFGVILLKWPKSKALFLSFLTKAALVLCSKGCQDPSPLKRDTDAVCCVKLFV